MNLNRTRFLAAACIALLFVIANPLLAEPLLLPGLGVVEVDNLQIVTFESGDDWEEYSSPNGVDLSIENGVYRAYTANPGYVWGLNDVEHTDVVVEAEVTPLTIYTENGAGVMCRADTRNNGDGYYFMINANGYFSIRMGQGNDIPALVDWRRSSAINTGLDRNVIRAVCLGNELAMYINGELVALVRDSTYSSGFAGLAIAAGSNSVDMAFDNVTLYDITLRTPTTPA
ncbi:MAG: hypothetical protein DIU68_009035 [Chloroflexota bacterium]|nr:MAG: hypothetical protein DIU68_10950 [Chloroflexota bacterium]